MPKRKASTSKSVDDVKDSQVETQITVIVPTGDFYMVFNSNSSESKRLLVSRYILCLSSKVFEAMIGDNSHFREANNPTLSHDGIREVAFRDDDFPAMVTIMNILHLQHDRVPPRISFTQLRETAMLCDKYDLTRTVGLWPATWAQHYVDRIEKKGFHHWLLVASVFKQKEAFRKITRHLILNSRVHANTGDLVTADGWPFTEGVSSTVVGKMKMIRAEAILKLQESLWERFQVLQFTGTGRRHCWHCDEHECERNDLEREQCDTWNLGCLVRYFPDLKNPRDNDENRDSTIMATINKFDVMDDFQEEDGYILSKDFVRSHIQGTTCGILPIKVHHYVNQIEGLELEIR